MLDINKLIAELKGLEAKAEPVPWHFARKFTMDDWRLIITLRNALPELIAEIERQKEFSSTALAREEDARTNAIKAGKERDAALARIKGVEQQARNDETMLRKLYEEKLHNMEDIKCIRCPHESAPCPEHKNCAVCVENTINAALARAKKTEAERDVLAEHCCPPCDCPFADRNTPITDEEHKQCALAYAKQEVAKRKSGEEV